MSSSRSLNDTVLGARDGASRAADRIVTHAGERHFQGPPVLGRKGGRVGSKILREGASVMRSLSGISSPQNASQRASRKRLPRTPENAPAPALQWMRKFVVLRSVLMVSLCGPKSVYCSRFRGFTQRTGHGENGPFLAGLCIPAKTSSNSPRMARFSSGPTADRTRRMDSFRMAERSRLCSIATLPECRCPRRLLPARMTCVDR